LSIQPSVVNLGGIAVAWVCCVAAAVAFLIARSGTASAEVEDIGRSATGYPHGGVARGLGSFRDGWSSKGDFTSLSVGGKIISSLGADPGALPDSQEGGRPLSASSDYGSSTDYSSSTLDGGLFPETVMDFGSIDQRIMNGKAFFGDSDYASGFSVGAFGSLSLRLSNLDPSPDRARETGSDCSSDGLTAGVVQCEAEEDLGSFITTSTGAAPDAGGPVGLQSPNLPNADAPSGGASLSPQQIVILEMIAAQKSFATTSPSGVIQGTVPPACGDCGLTQPAVDGPLAPTFDFIDLSRNPNSASTVYPLFSATLGDSVGTQPVVPEIPAPAMLLIGFGGLALLGRRSRRVSASSHL
jgi:hypothetical protein